MKKFIVAATCLFIAACGDSNTTITDTNTKSLAAVFGNFSTGPNEYPLTITGSYTAPPDRPFSNITGVNLTLYAPAGIPIRFQRLSLSNVPDPEREGFKILTAHFVTSPYLQPGIYYVMDEFFYQSGDKIGRSYNYTVQ